MSNNNMSEREADVKLVSDLRQLKDEYCQMKIVSQLGELKDKYCHTDIC